MDAIDMVKVGKKIKDAREKSGVKQKDLAKKLEITPQALSAYENGKQMPLLTVINIAKQLNISLDYLFEMPTIFEPQKVSTYADVVDMIETIADYVPLDMAAVATTYAHYDTQYQVPISLRISGRDYRDNRELDDLPDCRCQFEAMVKFHSNVLASFFEKREKMHNLLNEKTIDWAIYQAWYTGEKERLRQSKLETLLDIICNKEDVDGINHEDDH